MDGSKQGRCKQDPSTASLSKAKRLRYAAIIFPLIALVTFSGCIGTAAQFLYILKGNKVKAAYSGLVKKRVAVICLSDASSHGPDSLTQTLAKSLGMQLAVNVKKISVISNNEVEDWKDVNGWDNIDLAQMGRDLDADLVVALELTSYSIREGQTMYKGRSRITTTVYDMENQGNVSFVHGPELFEFPKSHARPAIGTTASAFEAAYLSRIVAYISRLFYPYEKAESFGEDAFMFR